MANADRIIDLLHEAKSRPAGAERARFLDEACGDDSSLKEQIASLLEADAKEGDSDFLKITRIIRPTIPVTEKPGDRIGRYKLLEQIGEGGCGVVYMAEQEEPVRRRVALKVIKLGMDTKQVIARFEAERQALAMMDHPNIAKIFDAGITDTPLPVGRGEGQGEGSAALDPRHSSLVTSSGRPFFVMELVRGIKITDYCDQNNLATKERLELFMQVCQAIQHAHQKGIIHRDIKPSNILVTLHDDVAVPKVIDFGIAKATIGQLTDKTVFTAFAQFIGTPAYMSPEQAQMSGLDIDTRADIYSLGVLLYELLTGNTPFDAKELLAAGMDEMRRKIREDEPAKPSTCLSTMQAIDLTTVARRRHVEPPKLIHLIRGDLDWLVMKCLEKDRTRRYETANALAMDLQRHLDDEPVVACPPTSLYRFQKLVRRNKLAFAAASAVIAALVLGLGLSTWMFFKEKQAHQRAVAAEQEARSEAVKSQQFAQFLQDMLNKLGLKLMNSEFVDQRKLAEAELMLKENLAKLRERLGDEHPDVALSLNTLTLVLQGQAKLAEAETAVREALAIWRKRFGLDHPSVTFSLGCLGGILQQEGKLPEAEAAVREALAIKRKQLGNEHPEVTDALRFLAELLQEQGKLPEAESTIREMLALRRKLPADDPQLATALAKLTQTLLLQQKFADAEPPARECVSIREKKLPDHWLTFNARSVLGGSLLGQKKYAEAEPLLLSGCEGMKQREGKIPANGKVRLQESLQRLVQLYEATGQSEKAAEWNKKLAEFDKAEAEKETAAPKP